MNTIIFRTVLMFFISSLVVSTSFADNCTVALERVEVTIATPPSMNTEEQFQRALKQCPGEPRLYLLIGEYYDHWWKYDISPEKQAYYNYLATEYYAKGIKSGKGDEIKSMKFKLAALESCTEDISEVRIRSVKPYVRLNIRVLFDFNSKELTEGGQEQLDVLGRYIVEANSSRIILEGHTDMAGAEDYNLALSVQRAESAKQYLIEKYNIAPGIIETQGYGYGRLADVVDPYNAKNRRVRVRKLPK